MVDGEFIAGGSLCIQQHQKTNQQQSPEFCRHRDLMENRVPGRELRGASKGPNPIGREKQEGIPYADGWIYSSNTVLDLKPKTAAFHP